MRVSSLSLLFCGCLPIVSACAGAGSAAEGEGEGDVGEGEGDVVGEGEGDVVGEGEGDVVGEGEGDVVGEGEDEVAEGGGVEVLVQLTEVGDGAANLFGVEEADGVFCVDDSIGGGDGLTVCADHPDLIVTPRGPATADWGAPGPANDPIAAAAEETSLTVSLADGSTVFGADLNEPTDRSLFLRVFVDGQLRGEWVEATSDRWVVARIDVRDGVACVEDLRDGDDSDDCP